MQRLYRGKNDTMTHNPTPHRLCVLECSADMGGVQHSTLNLLRCLDRTVWDVVVVLPLEGPLTQELGKLGLAFQLLPMRPLASTSRWTDGLQRRPAPLAWLRNALALVTALPALVRLLRTLRAEVLYSKGLQSHLLGGLAAWIARIPCVWHVQDVISERHAGINVRIMDLLAACFATKLIADGRAIAGQYSQRIRGRTEMILNGVDTGLFEPGNSPQTRGELGIPEHALCIGHVARVTPWKGQAALLEAFLLLAGRHRDAQLLFVGGPLFDGEQYMRDLQATALRSDYAQRIHFTGYRSDLPDLYRAMDIFAYPALEKDTSPLALLCALASGLPAVGFAIDGVTEIADAGTGLLTVPVGDVASLATALESLLSDAAHRKAMGEAARNMALRHFALPEYAGKCEQVLLSVLR
ncbi:MAG: glycosyltransferase family 4 protein [Bacteroidia bacterium]|nr:glycosyltransferase family 4 protein [Bacteroidia bacterium]